MRITIIVGIVAFVLGVAITRQYMPREVTKTVDKVMEVEHTVTKIKEVKKPDGTTETDTTIVSDEKKDEVKQTEQIKLAQPTWHIMAGRSFDLIPKYSVSVDRQILGPVWLGVQVDTERTILVRAGVQF